MKFPEAYIAVIGEHQCPFYKVEDEFSVASHWLHLPYQKPACMILLQDIGNILSRIAGKTDRVSFYCSGCQDESLIKMDYSLKKSETILSTEPQLDQNIGSMVSSLRNFNIFKPLDDKNFLHMLLFLRLKKVKKGDIVIRKGDPGRNLFIIVSGKVEVLNENGFCMAILGRGEIFGEMSLLSGESVVATIRVLEPGVFLYLSSKYFRKILNKFPPIQMYLVRLLADRISRSNVELTQRYSSAMLGNLADVPLPDLLQTLNLNQKSGVLEIRLSQGDANLFFKEGELIDVDYNQKKGEDAFFEVIQEKEGRFRFDSQLPPGINVNSEIGDLMWLLMASEDKARL